MIISSIIVDDFYNDPHETREFALQQEFNVVGNYPGFRSKPFYNQSVVNLIQDIVYFSGGKITNWATDEYNGAFQYATQRDRSWMHSDQTTTWAGICFLTPNAPITAGTGLFRHKETGIHTAPLILYRADYFHTSLDYFGRNLQDGRLFQTFFFDTER